MDVSVGAIGAAGIGAGISLLSLVISKEAKTSEFRQAWIDALRADVAEAISAMTLLLPLLHDSEPSDDWTLRLEPFARTSAALARIELRLNILEEDHLALEKLVREAEQMVRDAENGIYDPRAAGDLSSRTITQSRLILKREWDRVRIGEVTFQITKGCAVFTLIGAVLFLLVLVAQQ